MTMGQRVTGHGSSGSTNLSGSRWSRISTRDPLTHNQVNKIPRTGCFVAVMMFDFESTSTQWSWLETATVGSHDSWVVVSRGPRVTLSRVKKCDPLSSLLEIVWQMSHTVALEWAMWIGQLLLTCWDFEFFVSDSLESSRIPFTFHTADAMRQNSLVESGQAVWIIGITLLIIMSMLNSFIGDRRRKWFFVLLQYSNHTGH